MEEKSIISETVRYLDQGQHRIYCPSCHKSRKKHNKHQKEFAVNVDGNDIKYFCHHCGISGGISKNFNKFRKF